jgi:hypothetical protein
MLALGLLLNTLGIGLFCWLIFTLAVYALPFFVAINAGIWAYHGGAGLLGTPLVAVAAGGMTLAIAQIAFAMTQSLFIRAVIAAVFALPATFAGSCRPCDGTNRSALACLAGGLRLPRRGLRRRHSMDAVDHLHGAPTGRTRRGDWRRPSTCSRGRDTRGTIFPLAVSNKFE